MVLSGKQKLLLRRENQKVNSNWNLWGFFLLISFLPALILTIVFRLAGIKTIFWSERGTSRHPWFRGYISVFFLLWFYTAFAFIFLCIFLFLVKSLLQKKDRSQRKKAGKYILIFFSNQLVFNILLILLWKGRTKSNSIMIILTSFLLIILNSFFIHYFFSKPVMKLLNKEYPYYFPDAFLKNRRSITKIGSLKFKKIQSFSWAIMITLILVDFWILSLLFYLNLSKTYY